MDAAAADARKTCNLQNYPVPKNLPRDIRKWYLRTKHEGAPNTHYHLAGHPQKLSQQQVQLCLDELLAWKRHGRADPYPSIEVLAQLRPAVQQVLDATGVTEQTLIRRMKDLRPGLKRVKLRAMKQLTPKVKENRLKRCRELVEYTDAQLMRVVYIDAKSMPMLVSGEWGWVDTRDEEATLVLKRAQTRKAKSIMLNYYIAVCGLAGAVLLYFYTGTTGLGPTREDADFKASVTAGSGGGGPSCNNMLHCLPQDTPPPVSTAALITRNQPTHSEAGGACCDAQQLIPFCSAGVVVAAIVCIAHRLVIVLLALDLDQQLGWCNCHNVILVLADPLQLTAT